MKIKRVEVEVLTPDNKRVLRKFRVRPPRQRIARHHGTAAQQVFEVKTTFTEKGAEQALERVLNAIDDNNPNHKYRLVALGNYKYRLVWDESDDTESDKTAGA